MHLAWCKWRLEFKADLISAERCKTALLRETIVMGGVDSEKQLTIICRPKFHIPGVFSIEELVQYGLFVIEAAIAHIDQSGLSKKINVIYDRQEMSSANRDSLVIRFTLQFVKVLQDYYAERLACLYVIGANFIYRAMYAMIRPFLGERTKAKIVMVDDTLS